MNFYINLSKKNISEKDIYYLSNLISGYSILFLIKNINFFKKKYFSFYDKGWIGRFIEKYINVFYFKKKKYCDISYFNIEIKTISIDMCYQPLNDVCLMSLFINFEDFSKIFNIKKIILKKISKILWIPIIGNRNTFFLYKIIGDPFLTLFNNLDKKKILYEINTFLNFLNINKNNLLSNFYSKHFRFQFNIKKNVYFKKKIILKIFFKKKFIKYILLKSKVF